MIIPNYFRYFILHSNEKKKVNNLKTKETKPSTKNHYHYRWLLYDTLSHTLCNFDASSLFWYQEEAAVYVCGDARHMAHDVHKVLTKIIVIQGQRTPEEADQYLRAMETQGRYQKDVWVVWSLGTSWQNRGTIRCWDLCNFTWWRSHIKEAFCDTSISFWISHISFISWFFFNLY